MSTLVNLRDYEKYANEHMDSYALDYYRSGANNEVTLKENIKAFSRIKLKPRFLQKDLSQRTLTTRFLGSNISFPIGAAPTALQKLAHPEGELATARACEALGTVMILSTISSSSIEEVANAAPLATKWLQLYIFKDRKSTRNLIERAEKSGFKGLVLTVDAPKLGLRYADMRNKFSIPSHIRLANFSEETLKESDYRNNEFSKLQFDESLTWKDIKWLKSITKLPILVKGIMAPEDALDAIENGCSGIIVSNHGGRQLDTTLSTIEALPAIAKVVSRRCELYLDGGIRNGTDVLKALSLGAKGVFIGRPILWGLSYEGEAGVKKILNILKNELDFAMLLSGCASLSDINLSLIENNVQFRSNL